MEIPHWLRFERGLWRLNVGSCVGLKPQRKGDVSVCVFATIKTQDARAVRLLSVIDKHTRQCQAILTSGVIETVAELMVSPGVPPTYARTTGWSSPPWPSDGGVQKWEPGLRA